ncbi:LuxR family two component transcriptional regulator [Parascardovia denticolens IPLA 20019]|uniref:response regulator n=1 Tax=Parascardovia denticolens TaxID=78258 RepID=UPI000266B4B5|nr:response regulator transcription factor [Parascardovia denticolens]EIT88973.1 LuxR family two component transcriptional regulator [Parascardovia denticolens IPLA 20019]
MEKDHEATLLVMDNDRLSLAIITSILSKHLPHLHVLNPIDNGKLAIQACTGHHPPDLLLADISMTDINGLTVCKTIRRDNMTTKILMMSSFDIGRYAQAAFDAGAQGIIHKDSPQTILTAVRRVAAGQPLSYEGIRFQTPRDSFLRIKEAKTRELSPREVEVVELWSQGYSLQEIGERLSLSPTTVRTHLQHSCDKLGAANNRALISVWMARQ